jgi:hypothetical protein
MRKKKNETEEEMKWFKSKLTYSEKE